MPALGVGNKKIKMKLKIIDDQNRISGWFVTFSVTVLFSLANFVAPFFLDRALEVVDKIGYQINIAYATVVGVWFTKKTIKSFSKNGDVEFYSNKVKKENCCDSKEDKSIE